MSTQRSIRRAEKTPGILFERLADSFCKSLKASIFLFELKTSP